MTSASETAGSVEADFAMIVGLTVAVVSAALLLTLLASAVGRHGARRTRRGRQLDQVVGPQREVAAVRLAAQEALARAQQALDSRTVIGGAPGALPRLGRRLRRCTEQLAAQLRALETEPDLPFLTSALPTLRERAEVMDNEANTFRRTALCWGDELDHASRAELEDDLDHVLDILDAVLLDLYTVRPSSTSAAESHRRPS